MPTPTQAVIDLGQLTLPIAAPEIRAASTVAFQHGYQFAKLTTADGGVLFIAAQPALDGAPLKVQIEGPVSISLPDGGPSFDLSPLPPLAPGCRCPDLPPRAHLLAIHSAQ